MHVQRILVDQAYGVLYACADDLGGTLLQIAALMGVGLLYQGSAHRLMTEVRLREIA